MLPGRPSQRSNSYHGGTSIHLCNSSPFETAALQTHNVSLAGPHADFVVSLGSDGRVLAQGSFSEVLSHNDKLRRAVSDNLKQVKKADQEVDGNDPDEVKGVSDGKLVVEEESGIGHLSWASCEFILPVKQYGRT